MLIDEKN